MRKARRMVVVIAATFGLMVGLPGNAWAPIEIPPLLQDGPTVPVATPDPEVKPPKGK